MVRQCYYPALLSLPLLLLMASSLLFVVSSAEQDAKGAPTNSADDDKISLLAKRHVRITNDLGEDRVLKVHCKSKDNDLGIHYLSFHGTFQWKFKTNAFVRNTLFYCYMWWGDNVKGSFVVYEATRDDDKCTDCKWSIRGDGAYWFDDETGHWNLMYPWPKP